MTKKIEKIFKALGDKSRLRILNMLTQKPMCVCEITEILKLSQSTVSGHLRVLKEAELVDDSKDGLWVEYRLCRTDPYVTGLLELTLKEFASDPDMEVERKSAVRANREVICGR
jgi:ArsR family transcriptional regulator